MRRVHFFAREGAAQAKQSTWDGHPSVLPSSMTGVLLQPGLFGEWDLCLDRCSEKCNENHSFYYLTWKSLCLPLWIILHELSWSALKTVCSQSLQKENIKTSSLVCNLDPGSLYENLVYLKDEDPISFLYNIVQKKISVNWNECLCNVH